MTATESPEPDSEDKELWDYPRTMLAAPGFLYPVHGLAGQSNRPFNVQLTPYQKSVEPPENICGNQGGLRIKVGGLSESDDQK